MTATISNFKKLREEVNKIDKIKKVIDSCENSEQVKVAFKMLALTRKNVVVEFKNNNNILNKLNSIFSELENKIELKFEEFSSVAMQEKENDLIRTFMTLHDGPYADTDYPSTFQIGLCGFKLIDLNTLEVEVRRPGLLIGRGGRHLKRIEKQMECKIKIKEKIFF